MNTLGNIGTYASRCAFVVVLLFASCWALAEHPWPLFRGDAALKGRAQGKLSASLALRWQYEAGDAIKSSPVLSQKAVFFGSFDGSVYAVDRQTGTKLWEFETGREVEASPLLVGERVFIGSADFHFYALDARNGSQLWRLPTEDKIMGSANSVTVPNGKTWVLFGGYDAVLYCVEAESGKVVWKYQTENYINGTPAIEGDRVVFGGCDARVYVLSLKDGRLQASMEVGDYIAGSIALDGGEAYLGHYGNVFIKVDLAKQKPAWRFKENKFPYFSSPALTNKAVVFGGRDKFVRSLNRADGTQRWQFRTRGRVDASPILVDGKVAIASEDGRVYLLDEQHGTKLWTYETGSRITSSPAVVDGQLFIGADNGTLYAFGPAEKKGR